MAERHHHGSASRSPQTSPPTGQTFTVAIEQAIRKQGASRDLQRLVDRKCDGAVLLNLLAGLRHSDPKLDDLDFWAGQNRRQLKALVQRLGKCAKEIEALNDKPFKAVLAERSQAGLFTLPTHLRDYMTAVRDLLAEVSGRKNLNRDMCLAGLVRYVVKQTGSVHDREVAALVGAAVNKDYSALAHKDWRLKRYLRLAQILDEREKEANKTRR